ncbi:unnamed protein product [Parnassius apollo]|uniref:(apollo) hypothetical protein n=1 Tax=Parnassius apollo TaxID=110799 RepID=A0A8S3WHV3_PARAO|nr:unnamed protein product [Parnassius apollo]
MKRRTDIIMDNALKNVKYYKANERNEEQADNKLKENLALNSTEIDNLPKEMPDINNFLININQIDLESADRMKNQKENMNPNSAVTEEESLIKMTNSGNIAVNYESKLKSSVCSDTIENLFSKSSSFIENSPQCTTNDIFNLSQYIKTQWTDTSDNELILNRDILTRRPIQEKRVSSSSCNSSSSSRSSSSSSSSSNSSPCSSSNAQNVNSNVITCHINADGASTSQLATRSLRGRAILKSNYCVSPINAAESDPDLSDNDPTFQDPNEISTRLRSLSSSSTDSTSQPVTPQHEIQQPETSNVNEPNTTQRISRKRQRNPASWKQNISKALRNTGKSYISLSKSRKEVPARCIKNPCAPCRLKCPNQINEAQRSEIFESLKKDRCDLCLEYEMASVDHKAKLKEKFDTHLKEKDLCRLEKKNDRRNIGEGNICTVYDLQAVMQCPLGDSSSFYYISKLNCLNFTMAELAQKSDKKTNKEQEIEGNQGRRGEDRIEEETTLLIRDHLRRLGDDIHWIAQMLRAHQVSGSIALDRKLNPERIPETYTW